MKVLVTGASGFVGRHVVASFLAAGHEVRAMVRPSAALDGVDWADRVEVARADVRTTHGLEAACAGVDAVVHAAARMGGPEAAQFETTVAGTERLLGAARSAGAARVILASSYAVYDWSAIEGSLTEHSPVVGERRLWRRGPYTVAKVWQERVARRMAAEGAFELTVVRPGFVWGREHVLLSGMGQRYGPLYVVFGRSTLLPLTYVENCADAFVAATAAAGGETFNVVDDEPVTALRYTREYVWRTDPARRVVAVPYGSARAVSRLASALGERLFSEGGELPDVLVPERLEAQFKPLRFPNDKIHMQLGWRSRVSFDDALSRAYGERPGPATPELP